MQLGRVHGELEVTWGRGLAFGAAGAGMKPAMDCWGEPGSVGCRAEEAG